MAPEVIDKPQDLDTEKDDLRIIEEHARGKEQKKSVDKEKTEEEVKPEEEEENLVDEELPQEEELLGETDDKTEIPTEEITNQRGLDFKKIKEKHPEFFKSNEFRQLRDAYYREGKYTELFPTVEDATEAAENNETFLKLNSEVIDKGSMHGLLIAIKEASPDALKKVSESFLDSLVKIEPSLYTQAITPVVKNLARRMYMDGRKMLSRDAESNEGKALVATAKNLGMWAFDDPDIVDKQDERKESPELTKREQELEQREQAIARASYQRALNVAMTNMTRKLDEQILNGLNVDNEFLRDSLVEKIKGEIDSQISSDQNHMRRMGSLWKQAEANGYDNRSLSRIISAYLERARPIIPIVRNKFRSLAVKGKTERGGESIRVPKGTSGKAGGEGKINMKLVDPKKVDYSQTSDEDILSGKIKMRS